jgi:cytochrome c oxidase subunit 2
VPITSVYDPHSPYAWSIYHLSVFVLIAMGTILAIVSFLVFYGCWRYRSSIRQEAPSPNFGNVRLEIAYTLLPLALLTIIMVFMVRTMHGSDPPTQGRTPDVIVIGHQWWWEVRYPKAGFVTANEVHIPVDEPVLFGMESADVIHDFWVPPLGRKIDIIPGVYNSVWLGASKPGVYLGTCAEFCGQEHAWMRIRVIAQNQEDFARWLQEQATAPSQTLPEDAARGRQDFHDMTCINCHAIAGSGSDASIGPDLTHVASRETLAAGVLVNSPENLSKWLHNPDLYKPGSHMPNLNLNPEQIRDLVAYIETRK